MCDVHRRDLLLVPIEPVREDYHLTEPFLESRLLLGIGLPRLREPRRGVSEGRPDPKLEPPLTWGGSAFSIRYAALYTVDRPERYRLDIWAATLRQVMRNRSLARS